VVGSGGHAVEVVLSDDAALVCDQKCVATGLVEEGPYRCALAIRSLESQLHDVLRRRGQYGCGGRVASQATGREEFLDVLKTPAVVRREPPVLCRHRTIVAHLVRLHRL
jgi:hypothetical protein